MPEGLNRSGDFRSGSPVTLPVLPGTPVTLPLDVGNDIPVATPDLNSNPVTWTPSPDHFGNPV
jgi:hypothetical protein